MGEIFQGNFKQGFYKDNMLTLMVERTGLKRGKIVSFIWGQNRAFAKIEMYILI
jgi:hypothetical protein